MKKSLFILFLFIFFNGRAQIGKLQEKTIDSLTQVIKTTPYDTVKINAYKEWDNIIYSSDPKLDLELNEKIVDFVQQSMNKKKLSSLEIKTLKSDLAYGLNNIGLFYSDQGDNIKAIDYHLRSLKTSEEMNDKTGIASSLNNIGIIYKQQGDNIKALDYFTRSLVLQKEIGNKLNISRCLNNIGLIYQHEKNFEKALAYFDSTLTLRKQIGETRNAASVLSNIGSVYLEMGDYGKALDYQNRSLIIMEKVGDKVGVSVALKDIGNIYRAMGKEDLAITYDQKALTLSQQTGVAFEIRDNSNNLYEDYKKTGKYKEALEMYELNVKTNEKIKSENSQKEVMKQEMQYNFQKQKAIEEKEHEKQIAVHTEQEKKQKVINYAISAGLILVVFFSIFVFNRLRITRNQKNIIESQKHLVEEKQKEILSSITYAKRLQEAILPSDHFVKEYLPESFILYKPKDIVAGDFYYMEKIGDLIIIAAADCTGHGVPGAMVSVVCSNALNRTVLEFGITEPGKILDKVCELVVATFVRKDSGENFDMDVKDGMDISLASINTKTLELKWSGANNPLWYITGGEMKEITADKKPIGKSDDTSAFTTHSLRLEKGDSVFLFTDGYADQFGGEKGKKFKYKPFKEILFQNSGLSSSIQVEKMDMAFEKWRGDLEQVDDVCVIGIKL